MAYDNVPFFEARQIVKKNEQEKPEKTMKDFPFLKGKSGGLEGYSQATQGGMEKPEFQSTVRKLNNNRFKEKLYRLIEVMLFTEETENLLNKIENTINIHNQNLSSK